MTAIAAISSALPVRRQRHRVRRIFVALALLGLGILAMVQNDWVRGIEATLAAGPTSWATGTHAASWPEHQALYWSLGTLDARGVIITTECTSAFIAGPLLIIGGLLAASRRPRLRRLLPGVLLAVGVIVATNVARVTLIAWATHTWGPRTGFWWSHVIAGSIVTVLGTLAGLAVLVLYSFRRRRRTAAG